jgi:hypothetical protein
MADTLTTNSAIRGREQFGGAFGGDMWKVKATWVDQDAVAINDTLAVTMAVPGVVLGDVVVAWSIDVDLSDGTDQASMMCAVTAADVVTVYIQADKGEFAADALNGGVMKVLVGRPSW